MNGTRMATKYYLPTVRKHSTNKFTLERTIIKKSLHSCMPPFNKILLLCSASRSSKIICVSTRIFARRQVFTIGEYLAVGWQRVGAAAWPGQCYETQLWAPVVVDQKISVLPAEKYLSNSIFPF